MGTKAQEPDNGEQKKLLEEIALKRKQYREEACALAQKADIVIFVGGLDHDYDLEGRDRDEMKLPYAQDELVEALLRIHPETIVVMVSGSAVEMPWRDRVKALIWCYYSGIETGTALAEILTGKTNPSAKLPETFPVNYADTVTAKNGEFGKTGRIELKEGIFIGYRYYEKENVKPAFPFGFGLSYTEFETGELEIEKVNEDVNVSVSVTNKGKTAGAEVVQCYVSDPQCSAVRPPKELKAYVKVFLEPGETKRIRMGLPRHAFAYFDEGKKCFIVEPGEFEILVGNSSEHCPLKARVFWD